MFKNVIYLSDQNKRSLGQANIFLTSPPQLAQVI